MSRLVALALPLALASFGCSGADPGSPSGTNSGASSTDTSNGSTSSGGTSGAAADSLQHCVDVINAYRKQAGVTAYARSSALETYAAAGAKSDSQSGSAHGHFAATGGGGVAFAENELPGWPLKQYASLDALLDDGLKAMWDEGPGGGHYDNMVNAHYSQAGCGVFTTSSNDVWVTIDFK